MDTTSATSTPAPSTPRTPTPNLRGSFTPLICVVDFHHARGPEIERWFGVGEDEPDPAIRYDWPLLPFMALSDGAHASTEDFSYFTLLAADKNADGAEAGAAAAATTTSLFGLACTRQMDASQLLYRPPDVTRSTVQKAVVVIADSPQFFGVLRERLSVVTKAWFDQRSFEDVDILRRFQEALAEEKTRSLSHGNGHDEEDRDQYLGMSLRELVHEFRWQTLVLLKCCLLQPKMLFFGSRCERLCMMQFSLVSLIPGLLRNLQDCAGPELDSYAKNLKQPTSLRTSDRNSMLAYMGLPLQIFGRGSLFGPYTPLQQLDVLADVGTKSYIVGSTNSLLLQQRDRYSDILINLDEKTVNITSPSLRSALALSTPDRRWIDSITQAVNDTWDEANPGRPKTLGYVGSEEFIRLQFEEYLLSLLSSVKYHTFTAITGRPPPPISTPSSSSNGGDVTPTNGGANANANASTVDPSADFGGEFVEYWSRTENYRLWQTHTDTHLFEFVEPKHPCAGGLTMDDVQRRFAQQVQDLHLDERFAQGREVLGRNLAAGQKKASTIFNKFYADMEAMREAQRRRAEEAAAARQQQADLAKYTNGGVDGFATHHHYRQSSHSGQPTSPTSEQASGSSSPPPPSDLATRTQQTVQSVGVRASAYMSSWATWAGEKRKTGWGRSVPPTPTTPTSSSGWLGSGGGRNSRNSGESSLSTSTTSRAIQNTSTADDDDAELMLVARNLDEEFAKRDAQKKLDEERAKEEKVEKVEKEEKEETQEKDEKEEKEPEKETVFEANEAIAEPKEKALVEADSKEKETETGSKEKNLEQDPEAPTKTATATPADQVRPAGSS